MQWISGNKRVVVASVGGGTMGRALATVSNGRVVKMEAVTKIDMKFSTRAGLVDAFRSNLTMAGHTFAEQNGNAVISVAGPVTKDGRGIIRLTNHGGVKFEDLTTLADDVEKGLGIKIKFVNDGTIANFCEVMPGGVLEGVGTGKNLASLIVGNGIGMRMVMTTDDGLQPVGGGDEAGHTKMSVMFLSSARFGFLKHFLPSRLACGCGAAASLDSYGDQICVEALANGPALQGMFRKMFSLITINDAVTGLLSQRLMSFCPELTSREVLDSQMVQAGCAREGISIDQTARQVLDDLSVKFSPKAIGGAPWTDPIAQAIYQKEGILLGWLLMNLQERFLPDPLNIALVSGIGKNHGHRILPFAMDFMRSMGVGATTEDYAASARQVSSWVPMPNVLVGNRPSDEQDYYGAVGLMIAKGLLL